MQLMYYLLLCNTKGDESIFHNSNIDLHECFIASHVGAQPEATLGHSTLTEEIDPTDTLEQVIPPQGKLSNTNKLKGFTEWDFIGVDKCFTVKALEEHLFEKFEIDTTIYTIFHLSKQTADSTKCLYSALTIKQEKYYTMTVAEILQAEKIPFSPGNYIMLSIALIPKAKVQAYKKKVKYEENSQLKSYKFARIRYLLS